MEGKKNKIIKRLDLTRKKKNDKTAKKQLQKPSKKVAIKIIRTKSDRWKYLLGVKIKKIII